jgi:hypothetical protein
MKDVCPEHSGDDSSDLDDLVDERRLQTLRPYRRYIMAAKLGNINWTDIESQVKESKRSTGMVDIIRSASKDILSDGEPRTVNKLQNMIELAMNQEVEEGQEVQVNWITVKYALTHSDGFREVEKNLFTFDSSVKKPVKKGRK